jgi:hypothetical protein
VTASWVWHRADVVARRSALPVQVLPPLVGGVCGDDGARRDDDAGLARAELAGAMIAAGAMGLCVGGDRGHGGPRCRSGARAA